MNRVDKVLAAIGGNGLGNQDLLRHLQSLQEELHIYAEIWRFVRTFCWDSLDHDPHDPKYQAKSPNHRWNPEIVGEILKSQVKSWNHWWNHKIAILKSGRNPEITGENHWSEIWNHGKGEISYARSGCVGPLVNNSGFWLFQVSHLRIVSGHSYIVLLYTGAAYI